VLRYPHCVRLQAILLLATGAIMLLLAGCASLAQRDPVRVSVVGIEPMAGQVMEARFAVKLRVQNPNEAVIDFDGVALELELNGKPFATGVSDYKGNYKGSVPRFGETVVTVPASVSALTVMRQALGMIDGNAAAELPYVLRGRFGGGVLGGMRFSESGMLRLPAAF